MDGKRWTKDEDDRLKLMASIGFSAQMIADGLPGRTRKAVGARCSKLGIGLHGDQKGLDRELIRSRPDSEAAEVILRKHGMGTETKTPRSRTAINAVIREVSEI